MDELRAFLQQLANFALMLTFWVLAVVGMFDGVRKLTASGPSKRLMLFIAGYAVVSGAVGGMYLWVHVKERQLLAALDFQYKELPAEWANDKPLASRHEGSKAYATAAFLGEGVLLKHLDDDGNWVTFQPRAKDLAQRAEAIVARTRLAEQSQLFWRLALEWWVGCIIAAIAGLAAGLMQRRAAANTTAETDARKGGARGSP